MPSLSWRIDRPITKRNCFKHESNCERFGKPRETEDEIKDYFVGKYGPVILLEPSTEGISMYVWIVPPIALTFAMIAVGLAVYVMRKRQKNTPLNMLHSLADEVISDEEKEKYFSVINRISNE